MLLYCVTTCQKTAGSSCILSASPYCRYDASMLVAFWVPSFVSSVPHLRGPLQCGVPVSGDITIFRETSCLSMRVYQVLYTDYTLTRDRSGSLGARILPRSGTDPMRDHECGVEDMHRPVGSIHKASNCCVCACSCAHTWFPIMPIPKRSKRSEATNPRDIDRHKTSTLPRYSARRLVGCI